MPASLTLNERICATALSFAGIREVRGARANPMIVDMLRRLLPWAKSDETPWCSAYVHEVAWQFNVAPRTINAAARSWLKIGAEVAGPRDWLPGDVVVLHRGNPKSWTGHVGFYCRHNARYVWLLGGNQGGTVSIRAYRRSRILGVRRL